jgi:hypothetical protein
VFPQHQNPEFRNPVSYAVDTGPLEHNRKENATIIHDNTLLLSRSGIPKANDTSLLISNVNAERSLPIQGETSLIRAKGLVKPNHRNFHYRFLPGKNPVSGEALATVVLAVVVVDRFVKSFAFSIHSNSFFAIAPPVGGD